MAIHRVSSRLALGLVALAASTALAGACAGKTSSVTTPGGEDASVVPDAGPSPNASGCPATLPAENVACTKDGLLCEYGDDFNPLCNTVRVCSGTRWASPILPGGGRKCPSTVPTVPPNPSDCAATRNAVPAGQACNTQSVCAYDGAICSCGVHCSNYPIRMPDCKPDAGVTTSCCDTTKIEWGCFDGPPYCTLPRPRVGAPCTKEGDACAIDAPGECGQTTLECRSGVWNLPNTQCSASSARFKRDIRYVDTEETARLREDLLRVRLATYRYKTGDDASHLGFIIEDMPPDSPAVLMSRDRVDVYGYASMAVAAIQVQQKEIDALKAEIARLGRKNEEMKRRAPRR